MADIVNLKQKRKTKEREEKEVKASANRLKFGRTKEEKLLEKLSKDKATRHIDGHKLDRTEE